MSWLSNHFQLMIETLLSNIINSILKMIVDAIKAFLVNPIQMTALPGFHELMITLQILATAALVVITVKELLMNMLEDLGDMAVSPLVVAKNTMLAALLIWVSPLIVTQVVFPLVLYLTSILNDTLAANATVHLHSLLSINTAVLTGAGAGEAAAQTFVSDTLFRALLADSGTWAIIIVICIIALTFLIIGIQAGIRWAELYFLALMGPLLAITKASFGSQWNQWLRELVSVAFSQLVQYFSLILAIDLMVHPGVFSAANGKPIATVVQIMMIIGLLVFAIQGPRTLKNILSSGGASGFKAVAGLARGAIGGMPFGG
jgi:hypothetical protein